MSQRSIEIVVGRLLTDEDFRRRFEADRLAVLQELLASGLQLTRVEQSALLALDSEACSLCASRIDPRLQKVSLRNRAS